MTGRFFFKAGNSNWVGPVGPLAKENDARATRRRAGRNESQGEWLAKNGKDG
jgi:hypothetical protein